MIKKIIRSYLINLLGLYLLSSYIGGFHVAEGVKSLLVVGAGFTAIHLLLKPILNIITGPLNFLTFGLIGLAIDGAILYGLTLFFPQVSISEWIFPGFEGYGLTIAAMALNVIMVTILSAFILNLIRSTISSLCD